MSRHSIRPTDGSALLRPASLEEIAAPIRTDLAEFRRYFRDQLRSESILLDSVLRFVLRRKGKQVRPILVYLSADAAGGITDRTAVGAALVELLHTATLVHDDVVDESEQRRGLPSINKVWNNKTAVLVGDYLLAQGLKIANERQEYGFLNITSNAVQRMSRGELMQTRKTRKLDIDRSEYFRVIADKTASLLAACCEIGGLSHSNDRSYGNALREFGENLGMSFQIRDDLFDYIEEEGPTGKPIGNDLQERKLTLPLIHAFETAPRSDARNILGDIRRGVAHEPDRFSEIARFVRHYGGVAAAVETARTYRNRAVDALVSLPNEPARDRLVALADFVIARIS